MPRSGNTGHRVHMCSTVLDSAEQFSKVVALICTPTNGVGELLLPTFLPLFCIILLFCCNHSIGLVVM